MSTLIFGHKNPDTDSVTSAIAFSYLKNQLGQDTIPCVLGAIRKEAEFLLNYFDLPKPTFIENVKAQIKDLNFDKVEGISPTTSILHAYKLMENKKIKTLPILDDHHKLLGIVTMQDVAMELVRGDFKKIKTSFDNIVSDLNGVPIIKNSSIIHGQISAMAFYYDSIKGTLSEEDIIIVGDRYDIIEHAINSKVQLILLTGSNTLSDHYIDLANKNNVSIISVPLDTYSTCKLINQCGYIQPIMIKQKDILLFNENEYVDDIEEDMLDSHYRNYPIIDQNNVFLGFIGRRHLINRSKKKVILVDHNEGIQSANGISEAEILEIVDHHKLGGIATSSPINFRNMIVGSTCTIVYGMFKENNIEIPYEIAGALISGIISDTLLFKSPTTTDLDIKTAYELNSILNLDLQNYAMDMFKAGTSLEGISIEEIFYTDFKEFNLDGNSVGIGQVFTLDIDAILNRKDEFLNFIDKTHNEKNYDLTLIAITDIMKEGSYLLFKSNNENIIKNAFKVDPVQGVFVENLMSRKKQIVPKISEIL